MDSYFPKHFKTEEFVDSKTFTKYGNKAIMFMDPRILYSADRIREKFKVPIFINTYSFKNYHGSILENCGFRSMTENFGSEYSQHRFGRALDLHFPSLDLSAEDVRKDILNNIFSKDYQYITCIEADVSWLHIDCRFHDKKNNGIKIIYEKK